jgi:hypothetical protein
VAPDLAVDAQARHHLGMAPDTSLALRGVPGLLGRGLLLAAACGALTGVATVAVLMVRDPTTDTTRGLITSFLGLSLLGAVVGTVLGLLDGAVAVLVLLLAMAVVRRVRPDVRADRVVLAAGAALPWGALLVSSPGWEAAAGIYLVVCAGAAAAGAPWILGRTND